MDYSPLIEHILEKLGLNFTRREKYYISQNPMSDIDNTPSCQIFNDGWFVSYNMDINGKNRLHIKEICKMLGFLKEYVQFICEKNKIPIRKINQYKNIIINKQLDSWYDYKKYNELIDIFGKIYISQSDILSINEIKPINKIKKAKCKKKKTKMIELELSESDYIKCKDYIESRGLCFITKRVEPVLLSINGWKNLAIALRYPNGFIKYRLINSKMRYISTGSFDKLYEVRNEGSNMAIVLEGEIEAESIKDFINVDIYAMSNSNSINNLKQLEKYDVIFVLIDNDTFEKVNEGLFNKLSKEFPDKKIFIKPKIKSDNKYEDFNYLLINDKEKISKILENILKNA